MEAVRVIARVCSRMMLSVSGLLIMVARNGVTVFVGCLSTSGFCFCFVARSTAIIFFAFSTIVNIILTMYFIEAHMVFPDAFFNLGFVYFDLKYFLTKYIFLKKLFYVENIFRRLTMV
jgi:hypothetical protein